MNLKENGNASLHNYSSFKGADAVKRHHHILAVVLSLVLVLSGCGTAKAETPPAAAPAEAAEIVHRDAAEDLLLIVDFQNVYLPGNQWACPSMPQAMENTVKILEAPNAPDYIMSAYIAPVDPVGRWQQYNEAYKDINADPYLSELAEEMKPYAVEGKVAEKSTYSSLDAEAVQAAMAGKKAVVLTGVVADCCVIATMYDAIDMGYEVVYLYDCIGGVSPESEAEIRSLAEIFSPVHTTVMSSDEYLAAIG